MVVCVCVYCLTDKRLTFQLCVIALFDFSIIYFILFLFCFFSVKVKC